MNNIYKVCIKLNYSQESVTKQAEITKLISFIHAVMSKAGWREATESDSVIDYVFSIGGDGTMLHTMQDHVVTKSIVVGINAGNVGFLTPYNIENVYDMSVFKFLEENANTRVEHRSILKHSFETRSEQGMAVNEYTFTADQVNQVLDFSIEVDYKGQVSKAGHYKANALLISGPCGSTAYNMNSGGAIVDPTVRCMQIMMVAPTILGIRPLIIGRNSIIRLKFHNNAKVFIDGQPHTDIPVTEDETFSIELLSEESRVLLPDEFNFYSMLSTKLHWNNGSGV